MFIITSEEFLADLTGSRYLDVAKSNPMEFNKTLAFFSNEDRQKRMIDSEIHHLRPALAGVICELENESWFNDFMRYKDGHVNYRLRQVVGVVTRMIMTAYGFKTTGKKGSLGQRVKVKSGEKAPGAYHNSSGLSLWFTRAEHYVQTDGNPYSPVARRSNNLKNI